MDQPQVLKELETLVKEGKEKILPTKWYPDGVIGAPYYVDGTIYAGWHTKALTLLKMFLSEETDFVQKFIKCTENTFSRAQAAIAVLESLIEYIQKGFITVEGADCIDLNIELHRLFNRFHRIARQLRSRHEARPTLSIGDEYDVQDLLHALLKLYFDDVRPEEWTPSYAGKSARMDFLLKNEKTVIEVKKTRQGLADKELGDQLIIDVDRYKVHPDCQKLICFVYDPEGRIGNPEGLMNDLNTQHQGFAEVIIEPIN
ncbi:MAG: hypothetical protein K6F23_03080 [Solobacterium sp.]|nr:hypothetical protein [Solobacterium sp.]